MNYLLGWLRLLPKIDVSMSLYTKSIQFMVCRQKMHGKDFKMDRENVITVNPFWLAKYRRSFLSPILKYQICRCSKEIKLRINSTSVCVRFFYFGVQHIQVVGQSFQCAQILTFIYPYDFQILSKLFWFKKYFMTHGLELMQRLT